MFDYYKIPNKLPVLALHKPPLIRQKGFFVPLILIIFLVTSFDKALATHDAPYCMHWLAQDGQFVLPCSFAGGDDQIIVIDQNQNGMVDMEGDAWLFDADSNGQIEMVILFRREGNRRIAQLYDDRNGDGQVSFEVQGNQVLIVESLYWTVELSVEDHWYLQDGSPNYNILIRADGAVNAIYGTDVIPEMRTNNGRVDWEYQIVDIEQNGIPDYWTYQLLTPLPRSWSLTRFSAFVNSGNVRPVSPSRVDLWPFLEGLPPGVPVDLNVMFSDSSLINVDWRQAKIVRSAFAGYPIEDGWWVNSVAPVSSDGIVRGNFENPHAWYDLADDRDNNPELNVRLIYWQEQDINWPFAGSLPANEVRYSWNQSNDPEQPLAFEYKLGLFGTNRIESLVELGPYRLQLPEWESFPSWVVSKPWQFATFIATEGIYYPSSEGIYEWAPATSSDRTAEAFVSGRSEDFPVENLHELRPGLRGEYWLDLGRQPHLYFSAIDRKLHLRDAVAGHWSLGDGLFIRYENLGGPYINSWVLERGGEIRQRLIVLDGYLIFADDDESLLLFKRITSPTVLFETLPPTNHEEWKALGNLLEEYQLDFDHTDLRPMMEQFVGDEQQFRGVSLKNVRLENEGLRMVVDRKEDFSSSLDTFIDFSDTSPGSYVIQLSDSFSLIAPLTPANIEETMFFINTEQFSSGLAVPIYVGLKNSGLEDANNLNFKVIANNSVHSTVLSSGQLDLAAGNIETLIITWHPTTANEWRIVVRLEDVDGQEVLSRYHQIVLDETSKRGSFHLISSINSVRQWLISLALLIFISIFAAFSVRISGYTLSRHR